MDNLTRVTEFARIIGADASLLVGDEWVHFSCPLAPWTHQKGTDEHPSFGVQISTPELRVYCFSCQFAGVLSDIPFELRARAGPSRVWGRALSIADVGDERPLDLRIKSKKPKRLIRFPEHLLRSMELAYSTIRREQFVHPYLQARGVDFATARALDLHFDRVRQRIVFPVRTSDSRLRGLHGRSIFEGDALPYLMYPWNGHTNAQVWYGEEWVDLDKPVLVVESVFDLAAVYPFYWNTVCPLTASISEPKIKRLAGASMLWLLFDTDEAGNRARSKLMRYLPSVPQEDLFVPRRYKDPGEMPRSALRKLLKPVLTP